MASLLQQKATTIFYHIIYILVINATRRRRLPYDDEMAIWRYTINMGGKTISAISSIIKKKSLAGITIPYSFSRQRHHLCRWWWCYYCDWSRREEEKRWFVFCFVFFLHSGIKIEKQKMESSKIGFC